MATEPSIGSKARGAPGGERAADGAELTADDLRQIVRALGLVEIPEQLFPKVLEHVRTHRTSVGTFDAAGIDLANVVTAQPFRA